jgi:hypothetical protein
VCRYELPTYDPEWYVGDAMILFHVSEKP